MNVMDVSQTRSKLQLRIETLPGDSKFSTEAKHTIRQACVNLDKKMNTGKYKEKVDYVNGKLGRE